MKKYTRPELDISLFNDKDIVTASDGYTSGLSTWQDQNPYAEVTKARLNALSEVTKFVFQ
ncbi:MAG: hypothetical protein ACI4EA_10295 [Candidatus Ornithomonoglobus sp.]